MDLTEFGAPLKPKLPLYRNSSLLAYPAKVKEHLVWKDEPKPWANYMHHSAKMHSSIECHYLYRLAKTLGSGDYANLGTFKGLSTACLAYGLRDGRHTGKIYSVDLFNHSNPLEPGFQRAEFDRGITEAGLTDYVEACEGYTYQWAHKLRKLQFKFILIDADHHYETCKDDFKRWSPLLREDGLIAFHDCDMLTVDMVINEMGPEWKLVDHIHRLKTFKRVK